MKLYTVIFHVKNDPRSVSQEIVRASAQNYDESDQLATTVIPVWNDIDEAWAYANFQNTKHTNINHFVIETTLIWGPRA